MTLRLAVDFGELVEHEFDRHAVTVGRGPLSDIVLKPEAIPRTLGTFVREPQCYEWVSESTPVTVQLLRNNKIQYKSQNARTRWVLEPGDQIKIAGVDGTLTVLSCAPTVTEPALRTFSMARDLRPAIPADLAHAVAQHPHPGTLLRGLAGAVLCNTTTHPLRICLTLTQNAAAPHRESWAITPTGVEGTMAVGIVEQAADPLSRLDGHAPQVLQALDKADAVLADHAGHRLLFVPLGHPLRGFAAFEYPAEVHDAATLHGVALAAHEVEPLARLCFDLLDARRSQASVTEENRYYREREKRHYLFKELVSESPAMRDVFEKLNRLVDTGAPVLITGEAGTGKELLARAIHHFGAPKTGMLFSLNCARTENTDFDVELFGCVANEFQGAVAPRKGVFELADQGTVFLEEIDLLSPMLQGKLVRMLKEGEVRRAGDPVGRKVQARLVASIHQPLDAVVESNKLRRDLYLLLKDQILTVPSLRERHEDILALARTFLKSYARRYNKPIVRLDDDVQAALNAHRWPGNVRELQMLMEVAVLKCDSDVITMKDLTF